MCGDWGEGWKLHIIIKGRSPSHLHDFHVAGSNELILSRLVYATLPRGELSMYTISKALFTCQFQLASGITWILTHL